MIREFQFWRDVASQLRTAVPFVSEALNVLPLLPSTKIEYAATDNKSIVVNPENWGKLKDLVEPQGGWFPNDQSAAAVVLLHECLHVILKHKQRGADVPRRKQWARAVDILTNNTIIDIFRLAPFNYSGDKLEQLKTALKESGTFDERFRGYDTDNIYSTLCAEEDEEPEDNGAPQGGNGGNGDGDGESGGGSQPEQDQQGDSGDKPDGEGDGDGGGQDQSGNGSGSGSSKPLDDDILGDEDEAGSGVPDDVSELIDNQMADYLDRNASFAPHGSGLARELVEAKKKPPIKLSDVLRKIRDVIDGRVMDYSRPNRGDAWSTALGYEGRMPSYHQDPSDKVRELVICLDFSGSMGERERQACFNLVREAFKFVKREIRLLAFTDHIVQDEVVTPATQLTSHHSGGTRIASIIDYIEKPTICATPAKNGKKIRPSAVVVITDGLDPASVPQLERWKYKARLRSIIIGQPGAYLPGQVFHCSAVDGFDPH